MVWSYLLRKTERWVLKRFHGHEHIRQLVDGIEEPAALVLKRMGDTALEASKLKNRESLDLGFVANGITNALHEAGIVHTDISEAAPCSLQSRSANAFQNILHLSWVTVVMPFGWISKPILRIWQGKTAM
ncbi:uncharacterized protein Z518_08868 [Rhinocladiella mackenziei CBS 650.93]|uniref:Rhinocladiella mackenziei CBS 650.93 unplaced genomic scaffold supercont1.6, whole genome shotgun sequence n=1 Tax=Rhinocladiella mackenziei CBS 650.93 TaxID=1442369 RepID=A0A0D2J204_9EURO|nr:uncharacterized protein Z518_08868 [Rhinocladiella mackenziei CBS 650.93]KIX02925.1 hypothetical protein Z518_08868 [Rhinocladiella mackenziei CBS 650.93]